ncbi:MAG: single-stranded-DNA-specific exonuclease RecJ [Firmicutes bacterium]|nr:single-stranded-DNA-specific exonuclease RecJ [Bacillota bacterium]
MYAGARSWRYPRFQSGLVEELSRELSILPSVAGVLVNRGVTSAAEARYFLSPSLDALYSPWEMKGMDAAVNRLLQALEKHEKILIYGDYDVDGITATALLVTALKSLGACVSYFLPSRFQEGYGLQKEVIEDYHEKGYTLIVTVDCGVNAREEVLFGHSMGVDVVITDHHYQMGPKLEGAAALVNPLQEGCSYPWKSLAGVGVAFKLLCALEERMGENLETHEYLDLVALGTVADIVPLIDENRVLTFHGLEKVNANPWPGLKALIEATDLDDKIITTRELAFVLAPILNAAGRLGTADPAVELLLHHQAGEAKETALFLVGENEKRRNLADAVNGETRQMIDDLYGGSPEDIILLEKEGWPHGVIGIVASKLVDEYNLPAVLLSIDGDRARGSARSIPGFDITKALGKFSPLLESYGGHGQAAGLTIRRANIEKLRERLSAAVRKRELKEMIPSLELDGELAGPEIDMELAGQLEKLAPFGEGNEYPCFGTKGWEVNRLRMVGRGGNHLKLNLFKNDVHIDPIYFFADRYKDKIAPGQKVDIAVTLKHGWWRDRPVLDMEIKDIAHTGARADVCEGGIELFDYRLHGDRISCLEGLLEHCVKPLIYVGNERQYSRIRNKLELPAGTRFIRSRFTEDDFRGHGGEIVFYHLPMLPDIMERVVVSASGGLKVHLLFHEKDREFNDRIVRAAIPTAGQVEEFHALMLALAGKNRVFSPEKWDELRERFPAGSMTRAMQDRCTDILAEIGVIEKNPAGGFAVGSGEAISEKLADSAIYRQGSELKEESLAYQKFLLESGPQDLCAYMEGIKRKKEQVG